MVTSALPCCPFLPIPEYTRFNRLHIKGSTHSYKAVINADYIQNVSRCTVFTCVTIFKLRKSGFSSFLVKEVKFRQIEISQKLISYFWECIENTGNWKTAEQNVTKRFEVYQHSFISPWFKNTQSLRFIGEVFHHIL